MKSSRAAFESLRLSARLLQIVDFIPMQGEVWDLCCDHALIAHAAWLLNNQRQIYAMDISHHVIDSLQKKWPKTQRQNVTFLCEDMLEAQREMTGTIIIAGVGGDLICRALEKIKLEKAQRLILGPHKDDKKMLLWIKESWPRRQHWQTLQHAQVEESGRQRNIYVLEK